MFNLLSACCCYVWMVVLAMLTAAPAALEPIDSLKHAAQTLEGRSKVAALNALARAYWRNQPDSALHYAQQAQTLAESLDDKRELEKALNTVAYMYEVKGQYAKALEIRLRDMELSKELKDDTALAWCYHSLGNISNYQGDNDKALAWHLKALELREKIGDKRGKGWSLNNIAWVFENQNQFEKALEYREKAAQIWQELADAEGLAATLSYRAEIYSKQQKHEQAIMLAKEALTLRQKSNFGPAYNWLQLGRIYAAAEKYQESFMALDSAIASGEMRYLPRIYNAMAQNYFHLRNYQSAIEYAQKAIALAQSERNQQPLEEGYLLLSNLYEAKGDFKNAQQYFKMYAALRDSMRSQAIQDRILNMEVNYQINLREKEIERLRQAQSSQAMVRNLLIALIALVLIASALLYWRYRASVQAKRALQQKNEELSVKNRLIETQHIQLEEAFKNLKDTQQQLIQQGKLAALGEMAAGISHEIQNPINFVTNFVALAIEQNNELMQMLKKEDRSLDALCQGMENLKSKLERIDHHAMRASRIVKAILEYSRSGSGERVETDLNTMLKEYAQLCYHSYKMKELTFNVKLTYCLDESLPKLRVVTQDLGRVFLNVVQNAFYSVYQKKKTIENQSNGVEFLAEVKINSQNLPDRVQICIWDNGLGVPEHLKEKIFQPFFTTKSGTEGTGLGLSISREIVHAHGGRIWVESKEGEYAELVIELPKSAALTPKQESGEKKSLMTVIHSL